jgi:hypothetical protein
LKAPVDAPRARKLVIACGALAHEIAALRKANGWSSLDVLCLPPELHNRPERIAGAVRDKIREHRKDYEGIFVAYADCGTGGALDAVLAEEGAERIPGAHCYEFFAGAAAFAELAEAEPGTFYLTDFLLRHFDRLVIQALGIDRHPELQSVYFGNYRRLVYLSQAPKPDAQAEAQKVADRLGLELVVRQTGYGGLGASLAGFAGRTRMPAWPA